MLPVIYITDCKDDNTKARLAARIHSLIPETQIHFVGVTTDVEAAGNLVDSLDALHGQPGLILVNVAPRQGHAKKWPNGTPFGHFIYEQTNIFTTIDGVCVSLLKKLSGSPEKINMFNIPDAVPHFKISEEEQDKIIHTQFRSLEFLPRVASAVINGTHVPSEAYRDIASMPECVWWVDSFGNVKTTLLPETVHFEPGKKVTLELVPQSNERGTVMGPSVHALEVGKNNIIDLVCYNRLKDVPNNELGLIIGSSGISKHRFLEIVQQGKPVANILDIKTGTEIKIINNT